MIGAKVLFYIYKWKLPITRYKYRLYCRIYLYRFYFTVKCVFQGNFYDLRELTGWYGGKVLYFGDHVYTDLAVRILYSFNDYIFRVNVVTSV